MITKTEVAREERACEACGYTRRIKVTAYHHDGATAAIYGATELEYSRLCAACEDEARARSHEQKASRFRTRAAKIRAERAE